MTMFRATLIRSTLAMFAIGFMSMSQTGGAQTPAASAQSASLQAEVLKDWIALKDTMHKITAEMPADKFSFKPTPAQQSFGERVVHVANANVYFLGLLGGNATKPTIDPKATTKEAALKALDDSFDYGAELLKQQTDDTLRQLVASPPKFMGPSTRSRVMTFLVGHTWDAYGQMAVYLRLNGQVPPASQKM
jgi:uncharacterized damage-inducible protein DinB